VGWATRASMEERGNRQGRLPRWTRPPPRARSTGSVKTLTRSSRRGLRNRNSCISNGNQPGNGRGPTHDISPEPLCRPTTWKTNLAQPEPGITVWAARGRMRPWPAMTEGAEEFGGVADSIHEPAAAPRLRRSDGLFKRSTGSTSVGIKLVDDMHGWHNSSDSFHGAVSSRLDLCR